MKILHLLQSDRFSGAENVVCQIIEMFKNEQNIEMIYCSSNGQIAEALKERGIRFIPLDKFSVKNVKRVIKEEKPDIVHAHDMRASFYAALVCGKIPLVSHIHNNAFDSRGISVKSIAYLFAAKKAKHIFWVSKSSFQGYFFHKHFECKSSVLYNIIDVEALYKKMRLDINKYDFDVVYVGRLTYPKNPKRLLDVLNLIKEKRPDVKVAVVGTGDMEDETKMLATEYGLKDNISFLGFKSNPLRIMYDSKVMVMTSRWEGTPMCALEAQALGVPIVSTPTDGLKELVNCDENGYLTETDEILAQKILNILDDESLHKRLSQDSYNKALIHNNIEKYKEKILEAYQV